MSIRVILVPLFGNAGDRSALQAGGRLARRFDGRLVGMFARPDPADMVPLLGEGASPAIAERLIKRMVEELDRRQRLARSNFDACRADADMAQADASSGTASAEWVQVAGDPQKVVADRARLADLTVFTHTPGASDALPSQALHGAMLNSGRPVLLVPGSWTDSIGHRIAIAWNDRPEAARALALALPLVEAASHVVLLAAETARTRYETTEAVAAYLRWHDIVAERQPAVVESEPVGAALLRAANKASADLLVMGGYGRSRLSEMVFGGVTRHVLGHADLPVLLAH